MKYKRRCLCVQIWKNLLYLNEPLLLSAPFYRKTIITLIKVKPTIQGEKEKIYIRINNTQFEAFLLIKHYKSVQINNNTDSDIQAKKFTF